VVLGVLKLPQRVLTESRRQTFGALWTEKVLLMRAILLHVYEIVITKWPIAQH